MLRKLNKKLQKKIIRAFCNNKNPLKTEDTSSKEVNTKNYEKSELKKNLNETEFVDFIMNNNATIPSDIKPLSIENLSTEAINDDSQWEIIPELCHNLKSIVENPGIYKLEDIKNSMPEKNYNFLKNVQQPNETDMDQIPPYTPPSFDKDLIKFAQKNEGTKYIMSTSTISYFLSNLFYVFSYFQEANYNCVPTYNKGEKKKYMNAQRRPYTNFFRVVDKEKDIWALDSDNGVFYPDHKILMDLGKILERVYTMEPDHYEGVFSKTKQNLDKYKLDDDDFHRFMKVNNDICLRSQIDCMQTMKDNKKIVYEIKTRALAAIRYDIYNYKDYVDYEIDDILGHINSYEREYYDLIRGGFLKYFFQLKIGGMDGAFISYHNTVKTFGFEYVKRTHMEEMLFGSTFKADISFVVTSKVMVKILDEIKLFLKGQDFTFVKIGYNAVAPTNSLILYVELFNDIDYLELKNTELKKTDEFFEIVHYYQKYRNNKINCYKFEFTLYPTLNGVHNQFAFHDMKEDDVLGMNYKLKKLGSAVFEEYMNFLLNAYKTKFGMVDMKYSSFWGTQSEKYEI